MKLLRANDFHLASCQASLFTPEEQVSAARLMRILMPKWEGQFDAEPLVMPSSEGMPNEIPRITFQSKSNEWRCEIASSRINLFWRMTTQEQEDVEPGLDTFYDYATTILSEYLDVNEPRVGRLAAVLNWYAAHESPGLFLAQHFCKEKWRSKPLNRPENFELHAHKKFSLNDDQIVNSWVRNKTGAISTGDEKKSIVLVEQDLNTLAEELDEGDYNRSQISSYFKDVTQEFPHILRLYYPEE